MIVIINFIFNFTNFCIVIYFFFAKLLTSGILFLIAVNAKLIAKPAILGILPSTSVILALKSVFHQFTNVINFLVFFRDFIFKI